LGKSGFNNSAENRKRLGSSGLIHSLFDCQAQVNFYNIKHLPPFKMVYQNPTNQPKIETSFPQSIILITIYTTYLFTSRSKHASTVFITVFTNKHIG
jgi:hypothetical protein